MRSNIKEESSREICCSHQILLPCTDNVYHLLFPRSFHSWNCADVPIFMLSALLLYSLVFSLLCNSTSTCLSEEINAYVPQVCAEETRAVVQAHHVIHEHATCLFARFRKYLRESCTLLLPSRSTTLLTTVTQNEGTRLVSYILRERRSDGRHMNSRRCP